MGIRQRIINSVRELILERGFSGWTVDELSDRAQISKRTLYRYFASKEELLDTVLDDFLHGIAEEVDQLLALESAPELVFRQVLHSLITQGRFITGAKNLDDLRRTYPHLWNKIDDFRLNRIRLMVAYVIRQEPASLLADIDPRIVDAVVTSSIKAVINPTFILENGFTFEEAVQQLSRFLLAFLCSNN